MAETHQVIGALAEGLDNRPLLWPGFDGDLNHSCLQPVRNRGQLSLDEVSTTCSTGI